MPPTTHPLTPKSTGRIHLECTCMPLAHGLSFWVVQFKPCVEGIHVQSEMNILGISGSHGRVVEIQLFPLVTCN